MGITLVVNPGSTSKKYALYSDDILTHSWRFEKTGQGFEACSSVRDGAHACEVIEGSTFEASLSKVKGELAAEQITPSVIVVRVVAPGQKFQNHQRINSFFLAALRKQENAAPLHIPATLQEINAIQGQFTDIPIIAASDSEFHKHLAPKSASYSLASDIVDDVDFRRYGYHGLSVASVINRAHSILGYDTERCVVAHVGGGVSVTALKKGQSIETTMGFSPGSGLLMGSRAGDVDASALLYLMRTKRWSPLDTELILQNHGGLFGIAGESDVRLLLDRMVRGDKVATHAIDTFVYQINRAIVAAAVATGGVDTVIVTATVMERSSMMRARIVKGLEPVLGCVLSNERNDAHIAKDGVITRANSPVKVVTIRTDEMGEMMRCARSVLQTQ